MRISDWSSDVCSSYLDLRHARCDRLRPDLHPCLLCRLPPSRRPREGVGEAPGRRQGRRDASGGPVMTRSILLAATGALALRSEEHTSELQSLMRISYAVFCLTKKTSKISEPQHERL